MEPLRINLARALMAGSAPFNDAFADAAILTGGLSGFAQRTMERGGKPGSPPMEGCRLRIRCGGAGLLLKP